MRKARNADGSRKFDALSFLTSQQVTSFFPRLAAAKRVTTAESQDEERWITGWNGRIQEQNIEDLSDEVISEMPIQQPIMYDTHNICEMVVDTKLTKFSVQMLQDTRTFYQLDIESISAKQKQPYFDVLTNLVYSCSCKSEEQTLT